MPTDTTTFFLGFLTVFGALGYGLWRLERLVTALRHRVDAATTSKKEGETGRP